MADGPRLYLIDLCHVPDHARALCASWLSMVERERIERTRIDQDRDQRLFARAVLRLLIGKRCGLPPKSVAFAARPGGKPRTLSAPRLEFSVSHSGRRLLLGLASRAIGVDVQVRRRRSLDGAARHCCTQAEATKLDTLPDRERRDFVQMRWVMKEAVVKASGRGLGAGMSRLQLVADTNRPGCHVCDHDGQRWLIRSHVLSDGPIAYAVADVPEVSEGRLWQGSVSTLLRELGHG